MGLFDTIKIENVEHIGGTERLTGREWQTKTIKEPRMGEWLVRSDGQLMELEWHYEEVPEEERPGYNEEIGGFEKSVDEALGSLKVVKERWIESDFSGEARIVRQSEEGEFQEEMLVFFKGTLLGIKQEEKDG